MPTNTKKERKAATRFRKKLLKDGFSMMQYSVYIRHCASRESGDVHTRRVKGFLEESGQVSILTVTDKQYGNIFNYWGITSSPLPGSPQQLELF